MITRIPVRREDLAVAKRRNSNAFQQWLIRRQSPSVVLSYKCTAVCGRPVDSHHDIGLSVFEDGRCLGSAPGCFVLWLSRRAQPGGIAVLVGGSRFGGCALSPDGNAGEALAVAPGGVRGRSIDDGVILATGFAFSLQGGQGLPSRRGHQR